MIVEQRRRAEKAAEEAKTEFLAAGERAGVPVEWRGIDDAEKVKLHARYRDLAVTGQTDPEKATGSVYDMAVEGMCTALAAVAEDRHLFVLQAGNIDIRL